MIRYFGGPRIVASGDKPHERGLDFFPTPPWATRAFMSWLRDRQRLVRRDHVLGDPCCGQGHMASVLQEFSDQDVYAADVFDYGYGGVRDFFDEGEHPAVDWWIMNPPYRQAVKFAATALDHPAAKSRTGVAMLTRLAFLEAGRRQPFFIRYPPHVVAICVDRPAMLKGRWEPDATTQMPYCWIVWLHDGGNLDWDLLPRFSHRPVLSWIPAGSRILHSMPQDVERFAARQETQLLEKAQ